MFLIRHLSLGFLLLVLPLSALHAQSAPKKELSEQVTGKLGQLKALADAKNYKEIVRLLDGLITGAPAESYDFTVLQQIKGQVLLTDGQYQAAVPPLELSLKSGELYGYFDQKTVLLTLYTLSQLYCQQAAESKDPAEQALLYEKAYARIDRWLSLSPKVSADNQYFAASILYNEAMLDPKHPDLGKLRQSQTAVENSLYLNLKPSTQSYVLILAALQQLGDIEQSADILEGLVARDPASALYWQQLLSTYYNLASTAKDERETRLYNLRSLITFERAQAHGMLNAPKDNFSIIALYFNLHQFDRAAEMLAADLKTGKVENTRKNWELLSSAYQQLHDEAKATAVLEEATRVFPEDGQLEFTLAQLNYAQDKPEKAYTNLVAAAAKGHLDKPGQAYVFLAYVAYELKHFADAAKWATGAAGLPDVKKEDLARLTRAIKDAIKERDPAKL